MVFTIEPGLYKENEFGIRLENTVYIDKNGKKVPFSHTEFEKNLIDKKLLNKKELKWIEEWIK
jgi:Xaa-Pro aminopeptidase